MTEEIQIENINRKKHWSVKRRVNASRRQRKNPLPRTLKVNQGYYHHELILHLRSSTVSERVLVYEAVINETTLEEWVKRHRVGGRLTGNEIYLKLGMFLLHLNKNKEDSKIENLHCFRSRTRYKSWVHKNTHNPVRLINNIREIKDLCVDWTAKRRKKAAKEGHPQTWGLLRMTHVVELNIGVNTNFHSGLSIKLFCCLTGQQVSCAGVPHVQVELEDKQEFWVAACRIRERVQGEFINTSNC